MRAVSLVPRTCSDQTICATLASTTVRREGGPLSPPTGETQEQNRPSSAEHGQDTEADGPPNLVLLLHIKRFPKHHLCPAAALEFGTRASHRDEHRRVLSRLFCTLRTLKVMATVTHRPLDQVTDHSEVTAGSVRGMFCW